MAWIITHLPVNETYPVCRSSAPEMDVLQYRRTLSGDAMPDMMMVWTQSNDSAPYHTLALDTLPAVADYNVADLEARVRSRFRRTGSADRR